MDKFDEILNLLQKKSLTNEEQSLLNSLIDSDSEVKEFYYTYTKINSALKLSHLSLDDLKDYILYKNNLEPVNKSIINRIPEIELHLKECRKCVEEFKTLNQEYSELELFLSNKLSKEKPAVTEKNKRVRIPLRIRKTPAYFLASIIVLGFVYLSLLLASDIVTPANYKLGRLEDKSEFYITRGRATVEFQESIKALEDEDYDEAISYLQQDIDKNPDDKTIFYTYYMLGLAYLESSEKSYAGLFATFNESSVKKSLHSFDMCIEKNTSGKFPDITYNAHFYSAKACLILNDTKSAKECLNIVIKGKGSKISEAQTLLSAME
jgi:TolA-binding protein